MASGVCAIAVRGVEIADAMSTTAMTSDGKVWSRAVDMNCSGNYGVAQDDWEIVVVEGDAPHVRAAYSQHAKTRWKFNAHKRLAGEVDYDLRIRRMLLKNQMTPSFEALAVMSGTSSRDAMRISSRKCLVGSNAWPFATAEVEPPNAATDSTTRRARAETNTAVVDFA